MPLRIESPSASPHPASTQPAIVFVRLSIVSIEPSRKPAPGLRPPTEKSPPFTVAMRGRQAALACRRTRDYPRAPMAHFAPPARALVAPLIEDASRPPERPLATPDKHRVGQQGVRTGRHRCA